MPDSSLQQFDRRLASRVVFKIYNGTAIEFQFAPKIIQESNSSLWMEIEQWSIEPQRIHKGSSGRRLVMEWEYVATDFTFDGEKISKTLRDLKTYFFEFESKGAKRIYPIVAVKYLKIIPVETLFRLRELSITYSPELVSSGVSLGGGDFYPLHTKVNCQLELATQQAVRGDPPKTDAPPLATTKVEWY